MTCLVAGCTNSSRSPFTGREQHICHSHWIALPLRCRQAYWRATKYDTEGTSDERRAALQTAIDNQHLALKNV